MTTPRRPVLLWVAAIVTSLAGVATMVIGALLWWIQGCCGAPQPNDPDPRPLVSGLVVGLVVLACGVLMLWSRVPVLMVVLGTATLPIAVLVAARSSMDMANGAPFVILGWVLVVAVFASPAVRTWRREAPDR